VTSAEFDSAFSGLVTVDGLTSSHGHVCALPLPSCATGEGFCSAMGPGVRVPRAGVIGSRRLAGSGKLER
jgi:hypothetical protein